MRKELLDPYIGKKIKLVMEGNFWLKGTIEMIEDPYISFKTDQKTSLIHFDRIREVTPL